MAMTKTRRSNKNDDYSSISSSASQATTATTEISSSENNNGDRNVDFPTETSLVNKKRREDYTKNEETLVIDIDEAIDRLGMGMFQFQIVLACGLCFASDAMEYLLLSYLAVVLQSQWDLSEGQSDFISSVVFLGALVGTLILTPLGDKLGRRIIFAVTSATISLFGIVSAFCTTYPQILMVRFMVGFGIGGLTVPYDTLGEFMPNSRRGKNMLSTSFFWIAASLLVPLFAWLTLGRNNNNTDNGVSNDSLEEGSWRVFVILCSLPSIISTVLGIWFVPESPRWLLTRGKHEQSLKILRQAAAKNGKDPYLVFPDGVRLVDYNDVAPSMHTNNESSLSIDTDDNSDSIGDGMQQDTATNENRQQDQNIHTCKQVTVCSEFPVAPTSNEFCLMCSNPQWRKISFLLGMQWYGLTFMYYGAVMAVSIVFSNIQNDDNNNSNDGESFYFDYGAIFIASSAEIVGLILAILMVDRVGRVPTQVWAYLLGGFCIFLLGIFDFYMGPNIMDGTDQEEEVSAQRSYLILFAFLSRMFIMGATSITWLHTAELLPTHFRATGHGLANALGRVGGMTCPFIVSRDNSLRTIGIAMFSISIMASISVYNLPETAGKALGNFDVSLKEQARGQGQSSLPISTGQLISCSKSNISTSSVDDVAKKTTGRKFHGEGQTDEGVDERTISSFEII